MKTFYYIKMEIIKYKCLLTYLLLLTFVSCKKYITVDTPSTSIGTDAAFRTNTSAAEVLTGIYADMAGSIVNGSLVSTCVLPELSADNLTLFDPNGTPAMADYYKNSLEPNYSTSSNEDTYWARGYAMLFTINTAIDKLNGNQYLSATTGRRLLGEAHFIRAFVYFYLVNFYGEVPLVLNTNYKQNSVLGKNSTAEVYTQILNDLKIAEGLLDYSYTNPEGTAVIPNRLRPNLAAVNALQARVQLYLKNYAAAEAAATKVLSQPAYSLASLDEAFLLNSMETIWGLQPVEIGLNTRIGYLFLLPSTGPSSFINPVYVSQSLLASFLPGDARKTSWLGLVSIGDKEYYYPAKYKRGQINNSKEIQEYTIVLRVSELFLIRAEARNEQGKSSGAVEDINAIRNRSRAAASGDVPNPLPALSTSVTQTQLRSIILQERRVELFTEWGHRWFDLRRSGSIDAIMSAEERVKGGTWSTYKEYYPIPQYDLNTNTNLVQTPGYAN